MRVLLGVFVLATVALAVAVARSTFASPARASAAGRVPGIDGYRQVAHAPDLVEEPAGDGGGADVVAREAGRGTVTLQIPQPVPLADVPVDLVVVDGEDGEVLGCATSAVQRGRSDSVFFRVTAADGYVAEAPWGREVSEYISRRADRVRIVEPVRREADIRVRVTDIAGRPVERARLVEVFQGGTPPAIVALASESEEDAGRSLPEAEASGTLLKEVWAEPTGKDGRTRVRGVPHLLDERYWVVVGKGDAEAFTELHLGAFGEQYASEVVLPVASTRIVTTNSAIGLGGGSRCGYRCGGRRWIPATLDVLVRQQDGRMAAGLEVRVGANKGITDAWGRATFEGLRPGSYDIEVRNPDFAWSKECVELTDGEWRTFVFSERPGWTARAVLLDSVGRPVPFARVLFSSEAPVAYVRVEDGVQDLAFYTDASGAISFPGLHHAPANLSFHYGSRWQDVTLEENEPVATVRLPPP